MKFVLLLFFYSTLILKSVSVMSSSFEKLKFLPRKRNGSNGDLNSGVRHSHRDRIFVFLKGLNLKSISIVSSPTPPPPLPDTKRRKEKEGEGYLIFIPPLFSVQQFTRKKERKKERLERRLKIRSV